MAAKGLRPIECTWACVASGPFSVLNRSGLGSLMSIFKRLSGSPLPKGEGLGVRVALTWLVHGFVWLVHCFANAPYGR